MPLRPGEFARLIEDAAPVLSDTHRTVVMSRVHRVGQLACLARYDEAEAQRRMAIKHSGMTMRLPGPAPERASRPEIIMVCRYLVLKEVVAHDHGGGTQVGVLR
jgi:hypothetical protein